MAGTNSKIDTVAIPTVWQGKVIANLAPGESSLAYFEPDLDSQRDFADSLLVLTNHRIVVFADDSLPASAASPETKHALVRSWPLKAVANLRTREATGLGALEILGRNALEFTCSYTMAKSPAAIQFVRTFETIAAAANTKKKSHELAAVATICPSCGNKIEPPATHCESCTPAAAPPPVRSLWRLGRFARPRAAMITLGLVLTITSISFGLVPNYLTILLLHDVLIPQQNGLAVEPPNVRGMRSSESKVNSYSPSARHTA